MLISWFILYPQDVKIQPESDTFYTWSSTMIPCSIERLLLKRQHSQRDVLNLQNERSAGTIWCPTLQCYKILRASWRKLSTTSKSGWIFQNLTKWHCSLMEHITFMALGSNILCTADWFFSTLLLVWRRLEVTVHIGLFTSWVYLKMSGFLTSFLLIW